jgi:hypothetical protein
MHAVLYGKVVCLKTVAEHAPIFDTAARDTNQKF